MPPDHPEMLDRYRILSLLGRGSMGDVYLAVDPKFDRKIALKVMSAHRLGLDDEIQDMRRRFVHEALAAGRLNHPDIVTIHDADTDQATGWPFIAMEWVDGESLRSRLRRDGPLELHQALTLTARVARALDYAHRQGVVHRDIKPANLLLRRDDLRPKIADFGVAKLVSSSLTLTGQVLGSPNYMSPEQVKAEPVDGRTDLFALGVVLYESLAGRPAFAADSLAGITFKIVNVDPRPVGIYNPQAPPALQGLLDRALAKEPGDRFATGAEMAEALDDLAADTAVDKRRARPSTKELTLPAGIPDSGDPGAINGRGGGTVDLAEGSDSDFLSLPPTEARPRRGALFLRRLAAALVFVLLGFAAAHLWLEPPNRPELSTLTRNLGIFERQVAGLMDSAADSAERWMANRDARGNHAENVSEGGTEADTSPSSLLGNVDEEGLEGRPDLSGGGLSDGPIAEVQEPEPTGTGSTEAPAAGPASGVAPGSSEDPELPVSTRPIKGDPELQPLQVNMYPSNWRGHPRPDPGPDPVEEDPLASITNDRPAEESGGLAMDPSTAPPAESEPSRTAPPASTEPTAQVASAEKQGPKRSPPPKVPLTIALEKRWKLAYITIWVDGREVKTRRLEGGSWMRRLVGQSYEFEINVPAGERKIEAHISGLSTKLEAYGKITESFQAGRPKTLWIEVQRDNSKRLQLSWKKP